MKIQKIGHSCLLLEEGDKRLLIDPGAYSFAPIGIGEPEQLGSVDAILVTHEHADHFVSKTIKRILASQPARIVSHARIIELLTNERITAEAMDAGEHRTIGTFEIQALTAPHEALPRPVPPNLGFLVNGLLFHPGDSLTFALPNPVPVLALPVAAPWLTAKWAFETAAKLKPKIVIPIHDANIKDFSLEVLYRMIGEAFERVGITFRPLAPGEFLEI